MIETPLTYTHDDHIRRWGAVKDALGLNVATESIAGLSIESTEDHKTSGVNGATLKFESEEALETSISRLEETHQELLRSNCFSEATDVEDVKLGIQEMKWKLEGSNA